MSDFSSPTVTAEQLYPSTREYTILVVMCQNGASHKHLLHNLPSHATAYTLRK